MDHFHESSERKALAAPPVLMTESEQDYDDFVSAMLEEIHPGNIVELIFLRDFIEHAWHIRRLRWARTAVINIDYRQAIVALLVTELGKWFTCEKTRTEIANLLQNYGLEESAIEAQAIKLNNSGLEILGKEMALWEARRNKALGALYKTRRGLAKRARDVTSARSMLMKIKNTISKGLPNRWRPRAKLRPTD